MGKEDLIELLEPSVNALGCELVDIDLRLGRRGLLRVFIDKEPAVTLADCETVSRQIGDLLDVADPLPSDYTLEVSSPGLDRRLRTVEHFAAVVGCEIRLELARPQDGRRRFRGELVAVDDTTVEMVVDGTRWQLPLKDVEIARLVPTD